MHGIAQAIGKIVRIGCLEVVDGREQKEQCRDQRIFGEALARPGGAGFGQEHQQVNGGLRRGGRSKI